VIPVTSGNSSLEQIMTLLQKVVEAGEKCPTNNQDNDRDPVGPKKEEEEINQETENERPDENDLEILIEKENRTCENWTRRVSEFQKPISKLKEPIQKKLTEVQEVDNGCQSGIEPKMAEGLEKASKAWRKNLDRFKHTINEPEKKKLKKEKRSHLTHPKEPKDNNLKIDIKAKTRAPKSRTSIIKTKPKKEKSRFG
ncbi:19316_t:CDS:2, partial [Gigaspora rosea]